MHPAHDTAADVDLKLLHRVLVVEVVPRHIHTATLGTLPAPTEQQRALAATLADTAASAAAALAPHYVRVQTLAQRIFVVPAAGASAGSIGLPDSAVRILRQYLNVLEAVIQKHSAPDVDFVLNNSDTDGDKAISFEELGPALAAWKEAAARIPHDAPGAKSSACVLL